MFNSSYDWFMLGALITGMTVFLSWLIFGRFTMGRIEREINADGLPRPCAWDGPGVRVLWYAFAIAIPVGRANRTDDPTIDVPLVRSYATPTDAISGWILLVSNGLLTIMAVVGWFIWGGEV